MVKAIFAGDSGNRLVRRLETPAAPPLVSIILPVYNCEKYIKESIQSILDQDYSNFELIVINDGSTDDSLSVVKKFQDPRLVIIDQKNMGLAATLNKGISIARGELIARQDADDVSLPGRLSLQVDFFRKHSDVSVLGGAAEIIEVDHVTNRQLRHPNHCRNLRFFLCFDNPFVHSTVMFRKAVVVNAGGYAMEASNQPEDYELFTRLARSHRVANLVKVLIQYREIPTAITKQKKFPFPFLAEISARQISFYFPWLSHRWVKDFTRFYHFNEVGESRALMIMKFLVISGLLTLRFWPSEKICWKKMLGAGKRLILFN